ncbi:MAG: SDR family oxidoreductase [Chitinispirillaceae bacterium]|nr:SDR family oxidoreductase [Chitinispirillaceae bacterium]
MLRPSESAATPRGCTNYFPFMKKNVTGQPLHDATALVTGATSPLGRAVALSLAAQGADIVVHYRSSRPNAETLCREIRDLGRRSFAVRADFRKNNEIRALIGKALTLTNRLDILVNNAALYPRATLKNLSVPSFSDTMRVNAWAPIALGREFAKRCGRGVIVNLLDSRIVGSDPGHAGYAISKQALRAATDLMALEYAPGIRVNAVAPGLVLKKAGEKRTGARLARSLPLKRYGTPDDIARAVLFLAQSGFITGQCVFVDGGRQVRERLKGVTPKRPGTR